MIGKEQKKGAGTGI